MSGRTGWQVKEFMASRHAGGIVSLAGEAPWLAGTNSWRTRRHRREGEIPMVDQLREIGNVHRTLRTARTAQGIVEKPLSLSSRARRASRSRFKSYVGSEVATSLRKRRSSQRQIFGLFQQSPVGGCLPPISPDCIPYPDAVYCIYSKQTYCPSDKARK